MVPLVADSFATTHTLPNTRQGCQYEQSYSHCLNSLLHLKFLRSKSFQVIQVYRNAKRRA